MLWHTNRIEPFRRHKTISDDTLAGWLSTQEIAEALGVTFYRVNQALLALGLYDQGKRPRNDARRRVYPPGTQEKVDAWLQTH